jgi:hypothetical protein
MSTPEGYVVHAVCEYLTRARIVHRRISTTGIPVAVRPGSQHRFRRNPAAGVADIIACLAPGGRLCAIECKSAKGRQSPAQVEYQREIESAGGLYIVARCASDVSGAILSAQQ